MIDKVIRKCISETHSSTFLLCFMYKSIMNLKITKLPNRYCCMCMLTCLYASLHSLINKKKRRSSEGLLPKSTLMIIVTVHVKSVSINIPSLFVHMHSVSRSVCMIVYACL